MRTNLEKWNYYNNLLKEKESAFINEHVKPIKRIFMVQWGSFEIEECLIESVGYTWRNENGGHIWISYWGKKPTKKDIEMIKVYFEKDIKMMPEFICYHWKSKRASSGIYLNKRIDKNVFLNIEEAHNYSKVMREEKIIHDKFRDEHKKDEHYDYTINGYHFLGWQNGWKHVYYDEDGNLCTETEKPSKSFGYSIKDYPLYGKCRELKHQTIEVRHNQRGSENTVSCPVCKIYWKYDSSD